MYQLTVPYVWRFKKANQKTFGVLYLRPKHGRFTALVLNRRTARKKGRSPVFLFLYGNKKGDRLVILECNSLWQNLTNATAFRQAQP